MAQTQTDRWKEWVESYNQQAYQKLTYDTVEQTEGTSSENRSGEQEEEEIYIGFSKRLYAFVIDSLIMSIFLMEIGNFAILLLIFSLYYAAFTSSPLQGTIGKLAIGAIVVDREGNRISFIRALLRFYAYSISTVTFLLGYIMIALDYQSRSLHDFLCQTYVINKNNLSNEK